MFASMSERLAGLRSRYAEPHRFYHTQTHIDTMLEGLRGLGDAVRHRDAVELAIWYHDAVYDPAATDNEARSASLLRSEMEGLADTDLLHGAELMVLGTANHTLPQSLPQEFMGDAALFLDLDMAVLGSPPAEYEDYERAIAAEYVPLHGEELYRAGRTRFLRASLDRPRLFLTERFHQALYALAVRNVKAALRDLSRSGRA